MLYLLAATYGTVLTAEMLGDKTIYTVSSLSARFRSLWVFCGITAAFMCKVLAAVVVGRAVAELPPAFVAATSAATLFATALFIWLKKSDGESAGEGSRPCFSRALLISFAAVFFSEWGDAGQLATAALAARYRAPLVVWLGATLALATKGSLSMALGSKLRERVPKQVLRPVSVGLCVVMGLASAFRLWV